jgi:mono/diheme cytochrome c family protein
MDHKLMLVMISMFTAIFFFVPSLTVYADDDHKQKKWYNKILGDDDDSDHHKRKRERKRDGSHSESSMRTVKNTVYQDTCGECHFAYQPDLMPAASWTALMKNLDDHFGESIELDEDSIKTIADYLNTNSADNRRTKRGTKIIKSLKNKIPMRITEIPYLLHEHHEISPNVFDRESIGSFSNCVACHTTAEDGIYDDDNVRIPK